MGHKIKDFVDFFKIKKIIKGDKMKNKINMLSKLLITTIVVLMIAMPVSADAFPQITVSLINQEPDPVAPGNSVKMRFRMENEGGGAAENVEAKLMFKYPFSLYGDEEVKSLGTIAGYQTGDIGIRAEWDLLVDTNAATGDETVEFWYRVNGGVWIKSAEYNVSIQSRAAELAINEIKTDKDNIIPGTMTKVSFVLENLADNTLSDVKLNLDIYSEVTTTTGVTFVELPFTPIGSGNEKTLKNLAARQSKEIAFDLFTDADAESKAYKVPYTLTYSDSAGNNYTREGVLGLIVESSPDLSINLESREGIYAGAKGTVEIKIVNKGFSDVKFLDVMLSDTDMYEIVSNPEQYIGELDSDDYETAEYTLMMSRTAKDQILLPLQVEYRDANGRLYTQKMDLELKVSQKPSPVLSIVIWIVIIAIIVVAVIIIRKRRKKKKQK